MIRFSYDYYCFKGSTLRKRKMYEEFLSKVSILGKHLSSLFVIFTEKLP